MNKLYIAVVLVALYVSVSTAVNVAACWKDLNRCSPKTASLTAKFAYDCDTYCKKCKKLSGGKCVDAPSAQCASVLPNNKKCVCNAARKGEIDYRLEKFNINPKCWGNAKSLFY